MSHGFFFYKFVKLVSYEATSFQNLAVTCSFSNVAVRTDLISVEDASVLITGKAVEPRR